jgi:hypothetical protein
LTKSPEFSSLLGVRIVSLFLVLILSLQQLRADCAAAFGFSAACSSAATTPSSSSGSSFNSQFATSLLIIGLGVGIGLGIIYFITKAFESESAYAFHPAGTQKLLTEALKSYPAPGLLSAEIGGITIEYRLSLPSYRW